MAKTLEELLGIKAVAPRAIRFTPTVDVTLSAEQLDALIALTDGKADLPKGTNASLRLGRINLRSSLS